MLGSDIESRVKNQLKDSYKTLINSKQRYDQANRQDVDIFGECSEILPP